MSTEVKPGSVAQVDRLVDETGATIDTPDDSSVRPAAEAEPSIGATGPTNWWRLGLVALVLVAAILLALQLLGGNKGTDVIPGTPVAAPQGTVTP
jgi:hypothetical protein